MAELASVRVVVSGRVQGVLFRDFTRREACTLGLTGWVRNLPGGSAVEVEAEGERPALEKLVSQLKKGPPQAAVEKLSTSWGAHTGKYADFEIRY